jgi:hypothetical protein
VTEMAMLLECGLVLENSPSPNGSNIGDLGDGGDTVLDSLVNLVEENGSTFAPKQT